MCSAFLEFCDGQRAPHVIDGLIRRDAAADRKSTRLNSSHSQISYAVFCLKKKKITPRTLTRHPPTLHKTHSRPNQPMPLTNTNTPHQHYKLYTRYISINHTQLVQPLSYH